MSGQSADHAAPTCAGCGKALRLTTGEPQQFYTCETSGCGGNLTHLDRPIPPARGDE